jgi:hypothetical protein
VHERVLPEILRRLVAAGILIGINPGRFGGGTPAFRSQIPLARNGGIASPFPKRRELSAEFIQALIERWDGPRNFYRTFFITAVSPVGFTKDGKNYNYYDDPKLLATLRPFIITCVHAQLAFGARRDVAVVLGTGRNFEFFSRLNSEEKFFDKLLVVEHPRFIMQYKRPHVGDYLDKYEALLRSASRAKGLFGRAEKLDLDPKNTFTTENTEN